MSKRIYSELIQQCEEELRAGFSSRVQARIQKLNIKRLPREFRKPLANLCWRAGLTTLGLKIFYPIVQQARAIKTAPQLTAEERAEYALLLLRAGATNEAQRGLETVGPEIPDALLYRAFCHFSRWEHAKAVPLLESYLKLPVSDYKRLVGRVNLAAAQVACERYDEALAVLEENVSLAMRDGAARLLANSYEIRSQIRINRGEFELAAADLGAAQEVLGSVKTYDQLFVKKWSALLEAMRSKSSEAILQFRNEAAARGEFESVREADRFYLRIRFDDEVYQRLIFGTPSPDYRERLQREHPSALIRDFYVFGDREGDCLDLALGSFDSRSAAGAKPADLKAGRKIHQLLEILARDLYKPVRMGGLFSELFPNEYFDVFSSANRVHAWIWQLRHWFESNRLPFAVLENGGAYRLAHLANSESPCGLRLALAKEKPSAERSQWMRLLAVVAASGFSAKEACAATGISRTSMQRLLNHAIAQGWVERKKAGDSVHYVINTSLRQAA